VIPLAFVACNVSPSGAGPQLFNHCGDEAGDATCRSSHPTRPYCDLCRSASENQGCAASPPAVPACRPDPGNYTTGDPTSGPDTDATSSSGDAGTTTTAEASSGSTTGEGVACESEGFDEGCAEQNAARPYCVDGVCVGCVGAGGDEFCLAIDPLTPACDPDTRVCVACDLDGFSCAAETPVCDDTGACIGCTAHEQCPGTACHLAAVDPLHGQCFGEDEVVWVDGSEICPGAGTQASPSCSLAAALSGVEAGENAVINLAGGTPYTEGPAFATDAAVAIIGDAAPTVVGAGNDEASLTLGDGIVYIHGVRFADNPDTHGIVCENAVLWLQASEVRNNADYGVYTDGPCDVVIERSSVHGNHGGGLRQLGGLLRVDNSAVGHNGDAVSGPAFNLAYAEVEVIYATVAGNDGTQNDSFRCIESEGSVRNSIVVGAGGGSVNLDCFTIDFDRNAIDTVGFTGAEGTLVGEPYNPNWFSAPNSGDFRLAAPPLSPFGEVAVWEEGDPPFDADGTPRPQGGEAAYAGVDEP
jgi:hypothetical protein